MNFNEQVGHVILSEAKNDMPIHNDRAMMDVKSHHYIDQTREGNSDDNV